MIASNFCDLGRSMQALRRGGRSGRCYCTPISTITTDCESVIDAFAALVSMYPEHPVFAQRVIYYYFCDTEGNPTPMRPINIMVDERQGPAFEPYK